MFLLYLKIVNFYAVMWWIIDDRVAEYRIDFFFFIYYLCVPGQEKKVFIIPSRVFFLWNLLNDKFATFFFTLMLKKQSQRARGSHSKHISDQKKKKKSTLSNANIFEIIKTTGVFLLENTPLCNCPFFLSCEYTTALLLPSWLASKPACASSIATHLVCGPGMQHTALILITHDQRWVLQQFDYIFELACVPSKTTNWTEFCYDNWHFFFLRVDLSRRSRTTVTRCI